MKQAFFILYELSFDLSYHRPLCEGLIALGGWMDRWISSSFFLFAHFFFSPPLQLAKGLTVIFGKDAARPTREERNTSLLSPSTYLSRQGLIERTLTDRPIATSENLRRAMSVSLVVCLSVCHSLIVAPSLARLPLELK